MRLVAIVGGIGAVISCAIACGSANWLAALGWITAAIWAFSCALGAK